MAVTIKDIAKVCDVSYSTVSRVLNGKGVRKSAKSDQIIAIAKALNYRPNNIAIHLKKNQSNTLGLLIPDIANPHYPEITKSVEDAALAAGYQVFFCNTDWDVSKETMYRDVLAEKRVAGIIVMPVTDGSHIIFKQSDIPIVLLGSRTEEDSINYVVMDNVRASFMATEYLIHKGHRNLAYIGRKVINYTSSDRARGFALAIEKYGIPQKNAKVVSCDSYKLEGGYHAAKKLLECGNPPTGIVAFSDYVALGVMQAVEERGLAVGRDISIIGFDDILFSSIPKISLTTITPSKQELGRKAVDIILEKSNGFNRAAQVTSILEPQIIERDTCGIISH
ncbi:MAG TPA: LacI family transcriptional regulator [Ruminiclostridium sp.]|nr:LacI family transcriptional regulator [Ruminiclostridium sp.]